MQIHNWGLIDYLEARAKMQNVHTQALHDKQNHLILCSHPECYTIGSDKNFQNTHNLLLIQSDRGGSITAHAQGQNIFYFCFEVARPALFYKKVVTAFENLFSTLLPEVYYDKKNPGFYLQNRKIASLGFRYKNGVSLHGVSLNRDVDLDFFNKIAPCNLEGITSSSLYAEGITLTEEALNALALIFIQKAFSDV